MRALFLFVVLLCFSAASEAQCLLAQHVIRNGSGCNPLNFRQLPCTSSGSLGPCVGSDWNTLVSLPGGGAAPLSAVACTSSGPASAKIGFGEVLIDLSLPPIGGIDIAAGFHSRPVPNDLSLCGVRLYCQAAVINVAPLSATLQNALDVTFGD